MNRIFNRKKPKDPSSPITQTPSQGSTPTWSANNLSSTDYASQDEDNWRRAATTRAVDEGIYGGNGNGVQFGSNGQRNSYQAAAVPRARRPSLGVLNTLDGPTSNRETSVIDMDGPDRGSWHVINPGPGMQQQNPPELWNGTPHSYGSQTSFQSTQPSVHGHQQQQQQQPSMLPSSHPYSSPPSSHISQQQHKSSRSFKPSDKNPLITPYIPPPIANSPSNKAPSPLAYQAQYSSTPPMSGYDYDGVNQLNGSIEGGDGDEGSFTPAGAPRNIKATSRELPPVAPPKNNPFVPTGGIYPYANQPTAQQQPPYVQHQYYNNPAVPPPPPISLLNHRESQLPPPPLQQYPREMQQQQGLAPPPPTGTGNLTRGAGSFEITPPTPPALPPSTNPMNNNLPQPPPPSVPSPAGFAPPGGKEDKREKKEREKREKEAQKHNNGNKFMKGLFGNKKEDEFAIVATNSADYTNLHREPSDAPPPKAQRSMNDGLNISKNWKEFKVEDTIASLCRLPTPPSRSPDESIAIGSQLHDISHRIKADPGSDIAERAARELRKQIKSSIQETEIGSAAEVWYYLTTRAGVHFPVYSMSSKFLLIVEGTIKRLPENSQRKADLYHVLGTLASTPRALDDVKKSWTKVYNAESQNPIADLSRQPLYLQRQRGRREFDPNDLINNGGGGGEQEMPHQQRQMPAPSVDEDLDRLMMDCDQAATIAATLVSSLQGASFEDLDENPELRHQYQQCFEAETTLVGHRPWAESMAEKSLLDSTSGRPRQLSGASNESGLKSTTSVEALNAVGIDQHGFPTPQHSPPPVESKAQKVLNILIRVSDEVASAMSEFHQFEAQAREEAEVRAVTERSTRETRHNRFEPQYQDQSGHLIVTSAGSSRSPSPAGRHPYNPSPPLPQIPSQPNAINRTLAPPQSKNTTRPQVTGPRTRTPSPEPPSRISESSDGQNLAQNFASLPIPRGPNGARPLPVPQHQPSREQEIIIDPDTMTEEEMAAALAERGPSAKALGKRRLIDAYEADRAFDPDDIYNTLGPVPLVKGRSRSDSSGSASSSSVSHDENWVPKKPIVYAYDAAAERKQDLEKIALEERRKQLAAQGQGGVAAAKWSEEQHLGDIGNAQTTASIPTTPRQPTPTSPVVPPSPAKVINDQLNASAALLAGNGLPEGKTGSLGRSLSRKGFWGRK